MKIILVALISIVLSSCFTTRQHEKIIAATFEVATLIRIDTYFEAATGRSIFILLWETKNGLLLSTTLYNVNPYSVGMRVPSIIH